MTDNSLTTFWAEMSACEHFVQIYDADDVFMDTLTGFIQGGLETGHAAVVLATPAHREELDRRLTALGINVASAKTQEQFISLDAQETLAQFMVNGWPDDDRFAAVITDILERAGRNGQKVRAFGELVAVLWAAGHNGATVRLEHLWQRLCREKSFALFCAYPKVGVTEDATKAMQRICAIHSKVLAA